MPTSFLLLVLCLLDIQLILSKAAQPHQLFRLYIYSGTVIWSKEWAVDHSCHKISKLAVTSIATEAKQSQSLAPKW